MIVTTGQIIKVESGDFTLERSCETPGRVTVLSRRDGALQLYLPGNEEEARRFCAAYLRVVRENIAYRKSEVEPTSLPSLTLLPSKTDP